MSHGYVILNKTRRSGDAYPDFQSAIPTTGFQPVVVESVSDLYEESGATDAHGEGAGFLDLNNKYGYP